MSAPATASFRPRLWWRRPPAKGAPTPGAEQHVEEAGGAAHVGQRDPATVTIGAPMSWSLWAATPVLP